MLHTTRGENTGIVHSLKITPFEGRFLESTFMPFASMVEDEVTRARLVCQQAGCVAVCGLRATVENDQGVQTAKIDCAEDVCVGSAAGEVAAWTAWEVTDRVPKLITMRLEMPDGLEGRTE